MTATRFLAALLPASLMFATFAVSASEVDLVATLAAYPGKEMFVGHWMQVLPYALSAIAGATVLLVVRGTAVIRPAGWSVAAASSATILLAVVKETKRLEHLTYPASTKQSVLSYVDPPTIAGVTVALLTCVFALRVALMGNAAFADRAPRRVGGKRAVHGNAGWMTMAEAQTLLPESGGIVVGERYRVDRDSVSAQTFRSNIRSSWGDGGGAPLLCFDGSFGSCHGVAFAGSGGFKTASLTIPTALKWGGGLVVLDPSSEVAPMVIDHRRRAGRNVVVLDPATASVGFNALDWIGRFGSTKEEDIVAVATWIMTDNGRQISARDDFFRASALQLLTALIADVCLSGHTEASRQTLRQVRANLSEPEPKLRQRLTLIHEQSASAFVKENVAVFVNMTPETFSGVYANAVKETHWLSYPNYAALVSGDAFTTDELADGCTDIFVSLNLKVLAVHPGLARVVIGALMNAIYNRNGEIPNKTLFLLDEVARLGYLGILETARDAGRKYGLVLILIFQSIGQMREAYGGRDATSKWFESASWISFAAINDPDTAEYISRRCGDTTIEVDQLTRTSQMSGSSRSRSKQLSRRPLILPEEVMRMRADEQIVFTAGNAPLRCGRAIWFRRKDMISCVGDSPFYRKA